MLVTRMIDPRPACAIAVPNTWQVSITPVRFTSTICRHSSTAVCSNGAPPGVPGLASIAAAQISASGTWALPNIPPPSGGRQISS